MILEMDRLISSCTDAVFMFAFVGLGNFFHLYVLIEEGSEEYSLELRIAVILRYIYIYIYLLIFNHSKLSLYPEE